MLTYLDFQQEDHLALWIQCSFMSSNEDLGAISHGGFGDSGYNSKTVL